MPLIQAKTVASFAKKLLFASKKTIRAAQFTAAADRLHKPKEAFQYTYVYQKASFWL